MGEGRRGGQWRATTTTTTMRERRVCEEDSSGVLAKALHRTGMGNCELSPTQNSAQQLAPSKNRQQCNGRPAARHCRTTSQHLHFRPV